MKVSKFNEGDIVRSNNYQKLYYIISKEYKQEIKWVDRRDKNYEWYEYKCLDIDTNEIIDIDSYKLCAYDYHIIMHRFIFEDLGAFMKVLVFDIRFNKWVADYVSSWGPWDIHTIGHGEFQYHEVVPYNRNTEFLINTALEQNIYHNFSNSDEVYKFAQTTDLRNEKIYQKIDY